MRSRAAALVALFLAVSCRPAPELPVVLDLVAEAPSADFEGDAQVALFGTPAGLASELAGLHDAPVQKGSDPAAWAEGTIEIGIRLADAAPRRAVLDMAPFGGLRAQSATAALNDQPLDPLRVGPGRARVTLVLPAAAQRSGMNRLKLVFADTSAPVKAYRKRMAAVLYSIAVAGESAPPRYAPALSIEGGRLASGLPGAWRFTARLPADARLRFEPSMDAGATSDVVVRESGGPERVVWSGTSGSGPTDVALGLRAEGLVQVALRSRGGGAGWGKAAVVAGRGVDPLSEPPGPEPVDPRAEALRRALAGSNVLYVILDAAGARHFSTYGYSRRTTPEIDRIAAEGVVFENARTVTPRHW